MKALTILQPWASLIACGAKKIETRSWATKYRGPIAIHAAKNYNTPKCAWEEPFKSELAKAGMFTEYPGGKLGFSLRYNGSVIAIADLVDCVSILGRSVAGCTFPDVNAVLSSGVIVKGNEVAFGDYTRGRYAWMLANVRPIEPVPAKGMQRLWEWVEEKKTYCSGCNEYLGCYEACWNRKPIEDAPGGDHEQI